MALAIAEKEIQQLRRSRIALLLAAFFVFSVWRIASSANPIPGDGGSRGNRYTLLEQPETYDAVYAVFGFTAFSNHIHSFVFLVPILGLLLGYGAIVTPRENGQLRTVFALPCSRRTILLGKFLGRGLVLAAVIGMGMIIGWLIISTQFETAQIDAYTAFGIVTIGYGLVWLSFGIMLSSIFSTTRRVAAAVFTVFVGFTFNWHEIVIDLLGLFPVAHTVDPLQAYLIVSSALYDDLHPLLHLESHEYVDGFGGVIGGTGVAEAAVEIPVYFTWPVAVFVLLLWILVPLAVTYDRLRKTTLT